MDLPLVYDTLSTFDLSADLPLDPPEPGMVAIYALVDPRDGAIRYIGKTDNCRRRLNRHCFVHPLAAHRHKERWVALLRALGQRPRMRVLGWVQVAEADEAERAAVRAARAADCALTNLTDGGDGNRGRPASPKSVAHLIAYNKEKHPEKYVKGRQTRKARGASLKQRAARSKQIRNLVERREEWEQARLEGLRSEKTRAKMRAAQLRLLENPEHAALIAERWERVREAGRSPEALAKLAAATKARWADPEHRALVSARMREARAAKPRVLTEAERERLAALRRGTKASPELKARLAAAQKLRRATERATEEGRARLTETAHKTWAKRRLKRNEEPTG